jgi:hypothetical protein
MNVRAARQLVEIRNNLYTIMSQPLTDFGDEFDQTSQVTSGCSGQHAVYQRDLLTVERRFRAAPSAG